MFTGLVQRLAPVSRITPDGSGGLRLTISDEVIASTLVAGESIAVSGCCLTAVAGSPNEVGFDVGPETLARTNLASLKIGDAVNLERALCLGDPLGGHIVTGHIDAVGTIRSRTISGEWQTIWFNCPVEMDDLLVNKGSISVDGVSLTVVDVEKGGFSVMLIPHTRDHTTLGLKSIGASVNLEADLLAKHVQKLFANLSIKL